MPEFTRPATWDDLKALARLLQQRQVAYALVGGYAIAAHGFNRFSEDIDILVDPSPENSERWIVAMSELPDHATRVLLNEPDVFAGDKRYAVRVNDEYTIDVMPSVAGRTWEEMRAFIETIDLDGVPLRLLNLEGLLLTKQGARPKDQLDAAVLRQALALLRAPKP
ncbi:MAG TPA: nucleotidyl transferase AbiEii/AbiGii toxin family protein [Steroidobacteraceae bacterium]|nr:nucleotidyl transferase AbiEii/AbiGii toxin family protein [Steroidobacteraceae bacterium]